MPTPCNAAHIGLLLAMGTAVVILRHANTAAASALESNLKARDEARDKAQLARDEARDKTWDKTWEKMQIESAEKVLNDLHFRDDLQQVLKRGLSAGLEQRLQAAAHANSADPLPGRTGLNGAVRDRLSRTGGPFADRVDCAGSKWSDLHEHFRLKGYAYFHSCSLNRKNKALVNHLATWVSTRAGMQVFNVVGGGGLRVQDAWKHHAGVRDAAGDPDTLSLIAYLHDKGEAGQVQPFQTLNFATGTEQPIHSDVVHFDTYPRRGMMTASWIALEDIHPLSGPLAYYPGSHAVGLWDFDQLQVWKNVTLKPDIAAHYKEYERRLQEALDVLGVRPEYAEAVPKGTSFIWAASLLHGGSKIRNRNYTRLSQVTHYYLDDPEVRDYWVPRASGPGVVQASGATFWAKKQLKQPSSWQALVQHAHSVARDREAAEAQSV